MTGSEASFTERLLDEGMLMCCACGNTLHEPVLLDCLHGCCSHCVQQLHADDTHVTCAVCHGVTLITTTLRRNFFTATHVRRLKWLKQEADCDLCGSRNDVGSVKDVSSSSSRSRAYRLCNQCERCFCSDCSALHDTLHSQHFTESLDEGAGGCNAGGAVTLPSLLPCPAHPRKNVELLCFSCGAAKCTDCGSESCFGRGHDVQTLAHSRAREHVDELRREMRRCVAELEAAAVPLQRHRSDQLCERLDAARRGAIERLRATKRLIADALDGAYRRAEVAVNDCCDDLTQQSLTVVDGLRRLDDGTTIRSAADYSRALSDSGDVTSLLCQQELVLKRLRLLTEDVKATVAPLRDRQCIEIASAVPDNAEEVFRLWFGMPRVESVPGDGLLAEDEHEPGSAYSAYRSDGSGCSSHRRCSFKAAFACSDVAVAPDCGLLLAAYDHGLLEYDASGSWLGGWTPAEDSNDDNDSSRSGTSAVLTGDDEVIVLDCTDDGRVIVGLRHSRTVVALARGATTSVAAAAAATAASVAAGGRRWSVRQRLMELRSAPWCLAVCKDVLAVVDSIDTAVDDASSVDVLSSSSSLSSVAPARRLVLAALSDGRALFSFELEFAVYSLALTEQAVVVTSHNREPAGDGCTAAAQCVVAAYNYLGQRLWRRGWDEWVCGVCAAPAGRLLYLALPDGDLVTAASADDGRRLVDIVTRRHGLERPKKLSFGKGRLCALMAVLADDDVTVSVRRGDGWR